MFAIVIFMFGIFVAATLKITRRDSFEYPSCLLSREIELWNVRVSCRKYETRLSRCVSEYDIKTDSLRRDKFIISEKTWTLFGTEWKTGGTGKDLLKLNNLISKPGFQMRKKDFCLLLKKLSSGDSAEFQKEVWKLVYGKDM